MVFFLFIYANILLFCSFIYLTYSLNFFKLENFRKFEPFFRMLVPPRFYSIGGKMLLLDSPGILISFAQISIYVVCHPFQVNLALHF